MKLCNSRCYILHKRPFNDRSILLDLFSPISGINRVVARIKKQQHLQALYQPFQPLVCTWSIKNDLGSLKMIEPTKGFHLLQPKQLFCGFYVNELLLKLLPSGEPCESIYEAYIIFLNTVNTQTEPALRVFETQLLEHIGLALYPPKNDAHYHLTADGWQKSDDPQAFSSETIMYIHQQAWDQPNILEEAKRLNRIRIQIATDYKELKSKSIFN
ncbi:MAG: DNA repair protein RecO [Candidatus Comchoanobacterales bacterium]